MSCLENRGSMGFTLTEVMITSALSVIVMAGVTAAFIQELKVFDQEQIKNELYYNLEEALERIRQDMRLSSVGIGQMAFYPENTGSYSAISIPMSVDTNGDGLLEREATDQIIWNQTVIYHVRLGAPDQLIRSTFYPRCPTATTEMIYRQLSNVAVSVNDAGVTNACMPGESASSRVVFENLVTLRFRPPASSYDCYSSASNRPETYNWGSLVLGPSTYGLKLTVMGKNVLSSGYRVIVDKIALSASQAAREGESYFPSNHYPNDGCFVYTKKNGDVKVMDMSGISPHYGGYEALIFDPSSGAGETSITFSVYNDLLHDTTFDTPGCESASNCNVRFDNNFVSNAWFDDVADAPDMSVSLEKGQAWAGAGCGYDVTSPAALYMDYPWFFTATNVIYGGSNNTDMTILRNGCWVKLYFQRGGGPVAFFMTNVFIFNPLTGTSNAVTFNNGEKYLYMPGTGPMTNSSDWIQGYTFNKDQNYLVRFDTCPFPLGGDFDYDIVAGSANNNLIFVRNTGATNDPNSWAAAAAGAGIYGGDTAPTFADIDADGDKDMFLGTTGTSPCWKFYRNTGGSTSPALTEEATNPIVSVLPNSANPSPVFADLDGNGKIDIASGYQSGYIYYSLNVGDEMTPVWSTAADLWVSNGASHIDIGSYSSPDFVDIDGDGDLDMFTGCAGKGSVEGSVWFFRNYKVEYGSTNKWLYQVVTNSILDEYPGNGLRLMPRFCDIDADGDKDLFITTSTDTGIFYYQNTGTIYNAMWAQPVTNFAGLEVLAQQRLVPAFANMDGPPVNGCSYWCNHPSYLRGQPLCYENGVASNSILALHSIEVGYPALGYYRSRPYDTLQATPSYNRLKWTAIEQGVGTTPNGGKVDVRVRSANSPNMDDADIVADPDKGWTRASAGDSGFMSDGAGVHSLAGLPARRYVQYEARFQCGYGGETSAHTNDATAVLRDVTIDWPAATGLVDLQTTLGCGPDCGIVQASVEGFSLVKGVEVDMTIYKAGRMGTNTVTGILEIKPLNTGR